MKVNNGCNEYYVNLFINENACSGNILLERKEKRVRRIYEHHMYSK